MFKSSNYIPKTSAIPRSCPQCPYGSNHTEVCTNCGGKGGSGTSSKYKNKFSDFLANYGSGYKGNGKWSGYGKNGDYHRNGRNPSLGKLAQETGSGIVDLTKTALKETTSLARDAGSGTAGFLKDTGSGAVGLLKETGSGVKNLIGDVGSGAAGLLKSNPAQIKSPNSGTQGTGTQGTGTQGTGTQGTGTQGTGTQGTGTQGTGTGQSASQSNYSSSGTYSLPNNPLGLQGIDPYSYNGALVSKGGNYIPVTSDFSSFRK
jgi:hypothetical protein